VRDLGERAFSFHFSKHLETWFHKMDISFRNCVVVVRLIGITLTL